MIVCSLSREDEASTSENSRKERLKGNVEFYLGDNEGIGSFTDDVNSESGMLADNMMTSKSSTIYSAQT